MYHRIVVPLDGSSFGEHALPYAVAIARRTGAGLVLVHVHTPLIYASAAVALAPYGLESMPGYDPQLDVERKEREDTYLEDLSLRLQGGCNVATSHVLLNGRVDDELK